MQLHDQKMASYGFLMILNASVVNSYIVHKEHKPQNTLKRQFFQKKLALGLIKPLAQRRLANPMSPPAVRSTIHITFPDLMSAIPAQVHRKTARGKTLPNLPSVAPKQDEFRVPEVWSSCVQGILSNLLPRLLKGNSFMQFGFCCVAHFNVATVLHKLICQQELCVQVFSQITLV